MTASAFPCRRFAAVLAILVALAPVAVAQNDDDPFATPKKKPDAGKADKADAPGKARSSWGEGDELRMPTDYKNLPTFGPAGCPVAVIGPAVVDLKTYKTLRELEGTYEARGMHALSASGKYFAAAIDKTPNQTSTAVGVWDVETGKKVFDVPGRAEAYVDFLALARDKYLLVGGRHNNKIEVWDIEAGKMTKALTVPDRRVEPNKIAFTADGKFFACIAHDKVVVTETATNKRAATLASPMFYLPTGGQRPGTLTEAIFVFAWTNALRFSPDGTLLAAYSTNPVPRLICWNTKGKLVLDTPVPMPQVVAHQSTLEWLPDGSGWLVNGYVFDREHRRLLLSVRTPFATEVMPHLLDKDRIAGTFGEDRDLVRSVQVPWDKLKASVKAIGEKVPAHIAPYQAVALDVTVAGARGDGDETRKLLELALAQRLARDGVRVQAGAPTTLRFKVAEQAGDTLPIYERQSAFDRRGRDTGRTATEAKGQAVLELVADGEAQPLWRSTLAASSARSFSEEINDATLRKSMLENLVRQLHGLDMPYFIPKSRDHLALPAVVE